MNPVRRMATLALVTASGTFVVGAADRADARSAPPLGADEEGTGVASAPLDVLWITSSRDAPYGERSGIARLEHAGMHVVVEDDEDADADMVADADLVVITSRVRSKMVDPAILAAKVPIITWEPLLYAPLGFVRPGGSGLVWAGRRIDIVDPAHALASSLDGSPDVLSMRTPVSWAVPEGDVQVVATVEGRADRAVVFAYEAGAATATAPAPARRVGFFLPIGGPLRLSTAGWGMWDAAVAWALGEPAGGGGGGGGGADGRPVWTHIGSPDPLLAPPQFGTGEEQQTASLIADLDDDGDNDIVLAGRKENGAGIVWYEFVDATTGWEQHVVERSVLRVEAGGDVFDVDRDGDIDIVFGRDGTGTEIWWWENPGGSKSGAAPWERHLIKSGGAAKHHDMAFGDVDGDGAAEFVYWNQRGDNALVVSEIPVDPTSGPWPAREVFRNGRRDSEGLAIADVDGNGVDDIVGAGLWFERRRDGSFVPHAIDADYSFSRTAVGQLIPGGRPEVVIDSGDAVGPLTWYSWDGTGDDWTAHVLDPDSHYGHSLRVADVDGDGSLDIFSAEMISPIDTADLANAAAETRVYYGDGAGAFELQVVASGVDSHESRVADLDGDGDIDILGKRYNIQVPGLDVWLNEGNGPGRGDGGDGGSAFSGWERSLIDEPLPWTPLFVFDADVDGDGLTDVVTGGWWYRNPGDVGGAWERHDIGLPIANVVAIDDLDGDGDADVIGSHWQFRSRGANGEFSWGRNDGSGSFTVHSIGDTGWGPFLQGAALTTLTPGGPLDLVLSWNTGAAGTVAITVPGDLATRPDQAPWATRRISPVSGGEQIVPSDLDGDGDTDLMLGRSWLRNDGRNRWTPVDIFDLRTGLPDRIVLADVDGDGDEDAVIGNGHDPNGELSWYERPDDPAQPWTHHLVANLVNPQSVDVADLDADGDLDVVVGEHNMDALERSRLLVYENLGGGGSWRQHVLFVGDEHHDGAHLVDLDGDGDLDITSISFYQGRVVAYENTAG